MTTKTPEYDPSNHVMNEFIKKVEASGIHLSNVIIYLRELALKKPVDSVWLTALADALFIVSIEDTPPVGPFPMKWEKVEERTHRRKVFGGWLVLVTFNMHSNRHDVNVDGQSVTFVPDPRHQWKLEERGNEKR